MSIVSEMLKNPHVKKWYNEMTYRGVEITATVYVRRLSAFLERIEETPESVTKQDREVLYEKMLGFAREEQSKGRTPSYIVSELKAVYSYLKSKDVNFKRIPNPKNSMSTPTIQDETIPTREELARILQLAGARDKVSISLMAFAGLRPAVIGDLHGNKGLVMGDIDGWRIEENEIIMDLPLKITVRPELSKISRPYLTFLCDEGAHHLKNYLEYRLRKGEKIKPSSPVVSSSFIGPINHIGTNAIRTGIRESIKKAGLEKRPYTLRRYFASKLLQGEDNGILAHSYGQLFMGHKGSMMDRYSVQKGLLPEQLQAMRDAYKRCYVYLQTDVSQEQVEEAQQRLDKMELKNETLEEMLIEKLGEAKKEKEELQAQIEKIRKGYKLGLRRIFESNIKFMEGVLPPDRYEVYKSFVSAGIENYPDE